MIFQRPQGKPWGRWLSCAAALVLGFFLAVQPARSATPDQEIPGVPWPGKSVASAVGGTVFSAHTQGWAVDFLCKPLTPEYIVQMIDTSKVEFDQLIHEGTWVHISFAPTLRQQVLIAHFSAAGTTYTRGV
jgi:hypothetical protein